jgi:putative PIN family toxin of toxin-antitoxin system
MNTASGALRLVLDTNVLLDFWVFDDPRTRKLRAAVEDRSVHALRSEACDEELRVVLARSCFALDAGKRDAVFARWTTCSEAIGRVFAAPLACTDRDDQKFLDAAFSARADALVSKDRALLKLARRARTHGLRILAPRDLAL